MKKIYLHLFRIVLFQLLLFAFARIVFLIVNSGQDTTFSLIKSFPSFLHGLRMDLSVSAYFLLPAFFFVGLWLLKPMHWIRKAEYFYLLFVLVLLFLILPANILLYKYWSSLLSFRSLSYLKDASEIASSFSVSQLIIGLILMTGFCFALFYTFNKYFYLKIGNVADSIWKKFFGFVVAIVLCIGMIRGGLQKLPMNESLISYSDNNFLNQAAINPVWHLANDIYRAGIFKGNPFETMPQEKAETEVRKLFANSPDSFPQILTTQKPNIVFIILESFTADIVEALGGEKGITPNLNTLINDGVFFNSIYASGSRTDQGIVSLLNGWPATPYYSIMRSTEKANQLPSISKILLSKGYSTSFFYGGESNFSNLKVYCISQKFQLIVDEKNFSDTISSGGWGVPDEFVFTRQLEELEKIKQPFLSALMTLSNHEPFDVPGPTRFPGTSDADRFRNSAAYTDAALGEYFAKAKERSWYKNTLFIIAADHGHHLPKNTNVYHPEGHHIPLLFYGDVIKQEFRGSFVIKLGGHHDVAGTVLSQLGMKESTQFEWSKNLLNPTVKNFAYYQSDQLVAWVDSKYWYGYSNNRKKIIDNSPDLPKNHLDSMMVDGQSFIQVLYDRYRKY